ncbi:LacI family DNA-binding transcriptional regulator [Aureibacillus halotolerans]|uniref:LacI family transcriptional regulator n=1 Tax=Aureibacillus halotolerans TaxID=1508390 RepID=A0A4R6UB69_9BACI|nr:LacI family DNA-binding transcriptional regulator [Aureibacillus halotolerans]TDQ42189.1 LacI family transcriptional regulator [Aureibacillus halotolerans]
MAAKMKEVAKLANVSTATVSRVFHEPERVRQETREKVLAAVAQLNYQPNALARHLRRLKTNIILVVVPDITNTFFSGVLRGIEEIATKNAYRVIVGDAESDPENEYDYVNLLRQKQADGMILLSARMDQGMIEQLAEEYPVVLACDYVKSSTVPIVSIDNELGAKQAVRYLVELGHKHIVHIAGPLHTVLSQDRKRGFLKGMEEASLSVNDGDVVIGHFSYEGGRDAAMSVIQTGKVPDAFFCASDEMAFGVINALHASGYVVPRDVSVIGFDNIPFASIFQPQLTTIAQPMRQIGVKAMEMMLALLEGEALSLRHEVLQEELLVRETTKPNA